jgi:hypothetical protein
MEGLIVIPAAYKRLTFIRQIGCEVICQVSYQGMVHSIIVKGSDKLIGVSCTEFSKELAVFACHNKLLIALLLLNVVIIIIVINLEAFIVRDELLIGSAAWVSAHKIGIILVLIIGSLAFT